MQTTETKTDLNDDITFYMQGWEPEGKPKGIVCLIHGLGEHTGRYAHVGKRLNDAGYALFGFDLRGHGKSGGKRGHIPSLDVAMQDIRQFVTFQGQNNPGIPIFLYGHSLGAMFALVYAIQFGDGLNGLISTAVSLHTPLANQKVKVSIARILGSLLPEFTLTSGLDPTTISSDPEVVQKYIQDPLVHDKVSAALGKTMLIAIDFCLEHARETQPALLLMHGAMDKLTYPSGSEAFAKLAGETNKDVTLKVWDGMCHEIHNEPGKEDVFKVMIEWLDGHL